jgi:hypothetical protein
MARGGRRAGAGRPKNEKVTEVEEQVIAGEYSRLRLELALARCDKKVRRAHRQHSTFFGLMEEGHTKLGKLKRNALCRHDWEKVQQSPEYRGTLDQTEKDRERWVKDPRRHRPPILRFTRPKLSAAEKNKIADKVAKWATAWFGKPVS